MIKKIGNILALIFLVICVFSACSDDKLLLEVADEKGNQNNSLTGEATSERVSSLDAGEESEEDEQEMIYVHVCGAVINPGVYELPGGSRVYDAINLAGGFDTEADTEATNLVETVTDGEQIRIPFIGESMITESSGLIDINQAEVTELCEIPGIGESRAQAIVDYRSEHGKFNSVEELMNIPGIKEGLYARISPYVECK